MKSKKRNEKKKIIINCHATLGTLRKFHWLRGCSSLAADNDMGPTAIGDHRPPTHNGQQTIDITFALLSAYTSCGSYYIYFIHIPTILINSTVL